MTCDNFEQSYFMPTGCRVMRLPSHFIAYSASTDHLFSPLLGDIRCPVFFRPCWLQSGDPCRLRVYHTTVFGIHRSGPPVLYSTVDCHFRPFLLILLVHVRRDRIFPSSARRDHTEWKTVRTRLSQNRPRQTNTHKHISLFVFRFRHWQTRTGRSGRDESFQRQPSKLVEQR